MTRIGLSLIPKFTAAALLAVALTSCDKKVQLQHETAQLHLTLHELQAESKKLEAEIYATGNLGRYQTTQPQHVAELKQYIENIKAETLRLNEEKVLIGARAEALQKSLNAYRAKINN